MKKENAFNPSKMHSIELDVLERALLDFILNEKEYIASKVELDEDDYNRISEFTAEIVVDRITTATSLHTLVALEIEKRNE
ncbi:hypothetical protein KK120_18765 [Virgibacillus dakarensis]|nr:hypothetical protein [Virgibacillus dakarensis]